MTAAENTEKTPMDGAPEIDFDRFRPTRSAIQRRNIMDHFMRVLIAVAFVIACIPIGLMCAVYLVEYSNRGKLATTVSLLVDVMSGIPSIVAGLFAFSMFTILLGPGTINGFEGSVALSLLMLPTVVKSSEEMLKIVPICVRLPWLWALPSSARLPRSCCAPLCRASSPVPFWPSPA